MASVTRAQASSDTLHLTPSAANDPSTAYRAAQWQRARASEAAATSGTVPGQCEFSRIFSGLRDEIPGRMRFDEDEW